MFLQRFRKLLPHVQIRVFYSKKLKKLKKIKKNRKIRHSHIPFLYAIIHLYKSFNNHL
jgi:hypothetical protein